MRLIPNSWGSFRDGLGSFFREFNTCHDETGKFCATGAKHLTPAPKDEARFRAGTKNMYTVPVGHLRRFLYNVKTNEMILGTEGMESQIWDLPFHGDILSRHLGHEASVKMWGEWVRGYLYGDERLGTRVEDLGARDADTMIEDRLAQITAALVASGAKRDGTIIFSSVPTLPDTFKELLAHLGMGDGRLRRRAA